MAGVWVLKIGMFEGSGFLHVIRIYFNLDNQTKHNKPHKTSSMAGLHIFLQEFVLDHLTDQHIQHIETTKPFGVSDHEKV